MKLVGASPQTFQCIPHFKNSSQRFARHGHVKRRHVLAASAASHPAVVTAAAASPNKKQKPNLLTSLVSISSVPYSSYVPEPASFLHTISAEVKQIWIMGVLLLMGQASVPMRLALAATVALVSVAGLPPRLWRPQLTRMAGLCAIIFFFTAFGSDGAAPVLSDRAPPPPPTGDFPARMSDVAPSTYRYVLLNLGPFSVTKRSFSLGVTLTGLTFAALQSASLCLITTPPEKMALAVGRFMTPFGWLGVPVRELVLCVLLSLRFMATVFEEGRNLCLGLASRGIDWSLVGGRGALAVALRLCGKLFSNLLARCESIAVAMTARGFRGPEEHALYVLQGRAGGGSAGGWGLGGADVAALASLAGLVALSRVLV